MLEDVKAEAVDETGKKIIEGESNIDEKGTKFVEGTESKGEKEIVMVKKKKSKKKKGGTDIVEAQIDNQYDGDEIAIDASKTLNRT